jgi:hypothetical protein
MSPGAEVDPSVHGAHWHWLPALSPPGLSVRAGQMRSRCDAAVTVAVTALSLSDNLPVALQAA